MLGASELVTCAGFSDAAARGADQGELGVIRDGALAIGGDRVLAVGSERRDPPRVSRPPPSA